MGTAGIYKWVDDNGNVHYGDCPPTDCNSEEIQIAPEPSDSAMQEVQERTRRIQEYEKKIRESRKSAIPAEDREPTEQPEVWFPSDISCFSFLENAWGGRIADTRELVVPQQLDEDQRSAVRNIFSELEGRYRGTLGRYRGTMVQTKCMNPKSSPPQKIYRYKVDWDTGWQSDQIFRMEAKFAGLDVKGSGREFFWFLLSPEGLRYRKATTDISFGLDQTRYDVGILGITDDRVTLYLREGGKIRRTTVVSLGEMEQEFTLKEFFYTQGTLAETRTWMFNR